MICQAQGVGDHLKLGFACCQFANELILGSAIMASLLVGRHQERGSHPTALTISLFAHVSSYPLTVTLNFWLFVSNLNM
jgi:hypothetical protein